MIDIPKSPDLQSQQIQEMSRSAPDPFPFFGGGVWARDYHRGCMAITWNGPILFIFRKLLLDIPGFPGALRWSKSIQTS